VYSRFVKQLKPINVIIPFPQTLTEILGYDILRVRGDLDKVYNFLKFYGMFNTKRLQQIEGHKNLYVLTPKICVEALKLVVNPLTNMLSKMDERAKQILDVLEEVEDVEERVTEAGVVEVETKYCEKGSEISKKVREKIAAKIGKSDRTVRAFLSFLENSGFVSSDGGIGRTPKTFTLLYSIQEIRSKISGILENLQSANNLIGKMEEEAQKWLNSLLEMKTLRKGYVLRKNVDSSVYEKPQNSMPYRSKTISNNDLGKPTPSFAKTTEDSWQNVKSPIPQQKKPIIPNGMKQCPICAKSGKPMFFANKQDLNVHILGLHSGYPIKREVEA